MKTKLLIWTLMLLTSNVFSLTLNSTYSSSITFDIQDSPYYLASNCTISNNAVLTFPAGSEIIAYDYLHSPAQKGQGYKFIVNNGAIIANGNSSDSIYFTALSAYLGDYTYGDYWQGIEINTSVQSEFQYCSFRYAVTNDASTSRGGAFTLDDGYKNLEVSNSLFNNCSSNTAGGAIFIRPNTSNVATVSFENCLFKNNSSSATIAGCNGGGAITALAQHGEINLSILNCEFLFNTSILSGGVIRIKSAYLSGFPFANIEISNCNFENNSSTNEGGAISIENSKLIVTNSEFINNSASFGGAIYSYRNRGEISITESTFEGNYTDGNGGAIYLSKSMYDVTYIYLNQITINENSFISNSTLDAGTYGGAIFIDKMYFLMNTPPFGLNYRLYGLSINDNIFEENQSANGGGIAFHDFDRNSVSQYLPINIKRNSFFYNTVTGNGGAMFFENIDYGDIECYLNVFNSNTSTLQGGGIFLESVFDFKFINNLVINNYSIGVNGGGLYCSYSSEIEFGSNTIANNTAYDINGYEEGGGIYFADSDYEIYNSIVWDNVPDAIIDITYPYWDYSSYSNIEGINNQGNNNIDTDPLFIDPNHDNFQIDCNVSPCVNSGDNNFFHTSVDLNNSDRIFNPPDGKIDMGAYECQDNPPRKKGLTETEDVFLLYPNPTTDVINIECSDSIKCIQIYSVLGIRMLSKNLIGKAYKLDVNGLSVGTYFIKVEAINKNYTKMFIIEK
ncbi:MAG: T9SS type A sorting domain-containing protein [Saprospiraceae bacterium]|nr:T9SS type A sorting domain-containing protein [Saprospiraceae bacterium]